MRGILFIIICIISFGLTAQISSDNFKVGETAPNIKGIDQNGKTINSVDILKEQKILLIFYRGYWCPHCRKHLASVQKYLDEFTKKGVYVIVVSPEKVEKTVETSKKLKANFSIVHDVDNKIMNDYGVAFEVNNENVPSYYGFVSKKVVEYNIENNNVLPVPATYLIGSNHKFLYVHFDPDYKKRSDLEELLNTL
jgi:peroxiredoxin